jgi:hypothetical protein
MHEATVLLHFAAPIDRVFAAVTDHEAFIHGGGAVTRIAQEGAPERNGLGCKREVKAGSLRLIEEVTAWSPPTSYEYVVREPRTLIKHDHGRIELTPQGSGTDVRWTTYFHVDVPVVGGMIGGLAERLFRHAFTRYLTGARARVEGER